MQCVGVRGRGHALRIATGHLGQGNDTSGSQIRHRRNTGETRETRNPLRLRHHAVCAAGTNILDCPPYYARGVATHVTQQGPPQEPPTCSTTCMPAAGAATSAAPCSTARTTVSLAAALDASGRMAACIAARSPSCSTLGCTGWSRLCDSAHGGHCVCAVLAQARQGHMHVRRRERALQVQCSDILTAHQPPPTTTIALRLLLWLARALAPHSLLRQLPVHVAAGSQLWGRTVGRRLRQFGSGRLWELWQLVSCTVMGALSVQQGGLKECKRRPTTPPPHISPSPPLFPYPSLPTWPPWPTSRTPQSHHLLPVRSTPCTAGSGG